MNTQVLLAVWGESYIQDFLNLSLPSLLASGNIPTLSKAYPTKFVLLTRYADIPLFNDHPAFLQLKQFCTIEFVTIDDLLLIEFYSISLTLAYERAIKRTGADMINTYFIFLTADFIFADGAFSGLVRYMQRGYSGICAGNFQVLKEGIESYLLKQLNPITHSISLPPRVLLAESFKHLHPITHTNTINQKRTHNYRANRFYWRYNAGTLAGRFFLQHMLCIKPEVSEFTIAESCDYSFIPALCPSGNVVCINDSDDYLVIEIQSEKHELNHISKSRYKYPKLAKSLASWTTQLHRQNANHSIYFHIHDLVDSEKQIIDKHLNDFIATINDELTPYPPRPVHNPKWAKTVAIFKQQLASFENQPHYLFRDMTPPTYSSFFKRWFFRILGTPPLVSRGHYRFHEHQVRMRQLKKLTAEVGADNIVVLYDAYPAIFMQYCGWLQKRLGIKEHYYVPNLLLAVEKLNTLDKNKRYILFTMNSERTIRDLTFIDKKLITIMSFTINDQHWVKNIFAIIDRQFDYNKTLRFFSYLLIGAIGYPLIYFGNLLPLKKHKF